MPRATQQYRVHVTVPPVALGWWWVPATSALGRASASHISCATAMNWLKLSRRFRRLLHARARGAHGRVPPSIRRLVPRGAMGFDSAAHLQGGLRPGRTCSPLRLAPSRISTARARWALVGRISLPPPTWPGVIQPHPRPSGHHGSAGVAIALLHDWPALQWRAHCEKTCLRGRSDLLASEAFAIVGI